MTSEQLQNKMLNGQEYARQNVHLQSSPPNIVLCASYRCNMQCIFCFERGDDPDFDYDIYKNIFEIKLHLILRKATHIFFTGWGEFLLWPGIENFLDYLNKAFPEARKTFTTSGAALSENLILKMANSYYTIQISLHTSHPFIHRLLTQSSFFEQIVTQLDKLILLRKERNCSSQLWIALMFLITSVNIENLPDFVDFAGLRGVNEVICNYVTVFQPEHLGLSCFFLPQTTNWMFDEAQKRAQKYDMHLNLPPRFGMKESMQQKDICRDPYNTVFVDSLGNVLPCCFAGEPIGNINTDDFETIWNGKQYKELRSCLIEGKTHKICKNCYKFSPINVDDIRSHITFRHNSAQEDTFRLLGLET